MYWDYDSNINRFHNRFFSNNGPYEPAGNEYIGEVTGNALTFIGPARFQHPLGSDGRIGPNADSISVAWWLRDDHGNWQPWDEQHLRSSQVERYGRVTCGSTTRSCRREGPRSTASLAVRSHA